MKKIALLLTSLFAISLAYASPVMAIDTLEEVCNQNSVSGNSAVCQENSERNSENPIYGPGGILETVFRWILILTGGISVIMVIVGGFRYVISGGDSNSVQSAKNTIMYALIGVIVAGLAGFILRFVLGYFD